MAAASVLYKLVVVHCAHGMNHLIMLIGRLRSVNGKLSRRLHAQERRRCEAFVVLLEDIKQSTWRRKVPGGAAGLQNQSGDRKVPGGFDSLPSPPRKRIRIKRLQLVL